MNVGVLWQAKPRRRSELGLLLVGALVVLCAAFLLSLANTGKAPDDLVGLILGFVLISVFISAINRRFAPNADPILLPVALFLNGLGFVMISRVATANPADYGNEVGEQVAWVAVGLVVYAAVLAIVRHSRDLARYRYLLLVVAFVLLVLPLAPKLGSTPANENGAKLWIGVGSLSFQPVEIAKLLLVIFFASYLIEKRELLTIPTRRVGNRLIPDLRAFGPIAVTSVMSLLIIIAERDIGFPLILFCVFLAMLWVTTGRWTYLAIGLLAFVLATFVASHVLTQVNQRIEIWLDPWKYLTGLQLGYQPVQGEIAFGTGGIFGTGLGLGLAATPHVLPVPTSDFIFSIIGEELGLVGSVSVLIAYLLLIGAGLRAAFRARSEFARVVGVGLTATLGFQTFFILAGVVRLLPLTGVTLPFVSYGGSSLIANYALLALLMRLSDEGNQIDVSSTTTPAAART